MSVFYSLLEFLLPKAVELRVVATELTGGSRTSFVLVSYFLCCTCRLGSTLRR